MAPLRTDDTRVRPAPSASAPAAAKAAVIASGPAMARPNVAPTGDAGVRVRSSGQKSDNSVPPGGESLTQADIERLTPVLLGLDDAQVKLPTSLGLTKAEAEARLPYFVSDKTRSTATVVSEGGADYLVLKTAPEREVFRAQLAAVAPDPAQSSPVNRIRAIAKTAPADKPLKGLRVALDPGHFGGDEDLLEGKYVSATPHNVPPHVPEDTCTEGTITGQAARNLAARLTALGAEVTLTRQGNVARVRNRAQVTRYLEAHPELKTKPAALLTGLDLERRAERLSHAQPDIILTMHFDAEVNNVASDARKEVKAYVNGAFLGTDFTSRREIQRFCTTVQNPAWHASTAFADRVIQSICKATGAHPQLPSETGAVNPKFLVPVGDHSGIFARNLRQPSAITGEPLNVYLEGATYNHPEVFPAVLRDSKTPNGVPGGFIDRYAGAIAEAFVSYVRGVAGAGSSVNTD